jgi:hypothetical protein
MSTRPWSRREAVLALSTGTLGLALPGLWACGRSTEAKPPSIAFDQDECDWCRMTIDDPRLAATFVPTSGRALRFGEPGCLLAWLAQRRAVEGAAFVAAQEDGGWLAAGSARFGRGVVRTPMRFDIAAWRGSPEAAGEWLTWARLVEEGAPRANRG